VTFTPQRSVTSSSRTRGRDVQRCTREVLHGDYRHLRVDDLVKDDEVDRDRRVVSGDRGLVGHLEVLLTKIDERDPVGDGVD